MVGFVKCEALKKNILGSERPKCFSTGVVTIKIHIHTQTQFMSNKYSTIFIQPPVMEINK